MSKPANPVTLPLADYSPKHFLLAVVGGVATVTLNRPERKNPLTFESYRELTDFFRACAMDDEVKTIVVYGRGRQLLLRRRRVRDHRPAGADGHQGPHRLHPHDRRSGQGDAGVPAADHSRRRRHLRRRRRDHRHGLRPAACRGRCQGRVPVQQGRARRLRHGRLRDPAAHHRPVARLGTALYRPLHDRGGGRALGLLQPYRHAGHRCWRRRNFWPNRFPKDRHLPTP